MIEQLTNRALVATLVLFAVGMLGGNRIIAAGQIMFGLCVILVIVQLCLGKRPLPAPRFLPWSRSLLSLLILAGVVVVSVLANWSVYEHPFRDLKKVRYELIAIGLCLMPMTHSILREKIWVWRAIVFGGAFMVIFVAVIGVIAQVTGVQPFGGLIDRPLRAGRLGGISGSVMTYGYTMQFIFLLVLAAWFPTERVRRWIAELCPDRRIWFGFLSILSVVVAVGVYMSMSRGAVLGIGVGCLGFLVAMRSKVLWLLAVIALIGLGWYARENQSRYFRSLNKDTARYAQWKGAALAFLDHPLFGLGHRQFEKQSDKLKQSYGMPPDTRKRKYFLGHAHNNFLESFASNGVFGGLALIAFCGFWLTESWASSDGRRFFIPVVLAFIASGMVENTFTDSEVLHTILFLYVLSHVILRVGDAEQPVET